MEKLRVCRICLVDNVRMYIVNDRDLQELYETLTDIPFVTEDSRPLLACFFCCTKLKQCCELQRKCLKAEELFAQMMNEPNTLINRGQLKCFSGFIVTPVETISIVDVNHIKSIAVKEELPAACVDDVIEPEEQHERDVTDLILENVQMVYSYVQNTPALHCYESSSEDDVPLTQFKIEVEDEQEVPRKERRASDTTRAAVAKKQKQHVLGKKLEDVITENQKKNEASVTRVTQNTQKLTSKHIPQFHETLTTATPRVDNSVIDTTSDTNCCNRIKKLNFTNHTRIRTGGVPYTCDICQYSCNKKVNLIQHIRVHTGEKPFKCEYCQKCLSDKKNLTYHIRTHTGEKPYKCEYCQRCFGSKSTLTTHIRTHTSEKPYKCEECQFCFSQKSALVRHIRTHTGEKPYKCEQCQVSYTQKFTLMKHIRHKHVSGKPFECGYCQRGFNNRSSLTTHIRTHTSEKPYKCEQCQVSYTQKFTLMKHIRHKHVSGKPFECGYCQRGFNNRSTLTTHIRTHTSEKPYKCEECQLCFSQKGSLIRHIRTHTGERPYKCEKCQLCFIQKFNLMKHISHKHAGEKLYK